MIADAMTLLDDDVVVVTSKVVSKAEGAVVDLATVEPSPFAADFAAPLGQGPAPRRGRAVRRRRASYG